MPQATVALCFDFDAVSTWLHTFKASDSLTKHSRGIFGAEVGSQRILDVLDEAIPVSLTRFRTSVEA